MVGFLVRVVNVANIHTYICNFIVLIDIKIYRTYIFIEFCYARWQCTVSNS